MNPEKQNVGKSVDFKSTGSKAMKYIDIRTLSRMSYADRQMCNSTPILLVVLQQGNYSFLVIKIQYQWQPK